MWRHCSLGRAEWEARGDPAQRRAMARTLKPGGAPVEDEEAVGADSAVVAAGRALASSASGGS